MLEPRLAAQLACAAALVIAATACTTNKSADDKAMERAYELKASVTGSRIRRRIDPETGEPDLGFAVLSLKGESARAMLRSMKSPIDPTK